MLDERSEDAALDVTCREAAAWTSCYIDEHLSEQDKARMRLHLIRCLACRRYVDQIAMVRRLVAALPGPDPAPGRLARIRAFYSSRNREG
jgi:predicted anti-sigma-YlaC factor YlaD